MKTAEFQQHIVETAAYRKRLIMAKKGCVQLMSNET